MKLRRLGIATFNLFNLNEPGRAIYTNTAGRSQAAYDLKDTHIHQDIRESLDHILVSQEFYDNSRKRIWMFDGMVVNNDHLNFDDHKGLGTNDHGIVRATFNYRPAPAPPV